MIQWEAVLSFHYFINISRLNSVLILAVVLSYIKLNFSLIPYQNKMIMSITRVHMSITIKQWGELYAKSEWLNISF